MFDTIGRTLDPDAGRRRSASLLLTSLLIGSTLGIGAWLGIAPEGPPAEAVPGEWVDLIEPPEPAAPGLPIPTAPPPGGGGSGNADGDVAPPPTPEEARPSRLVAHVPEAIVPSLVTKGQGDGDGTAQGSGSGEGEGGPGTCTSGDCANGGHYLVVHHAELEIRGRSKLQYPYGAQGFGRVRCVAQVWIDDRGKPSHVDVDRCPSEFHEATKRGLLRWRWRPPTDELGRTVHARTTIAVVFEPR